MDADLEIMFQRYLDAKAKIAEQEEIIEELKPTLTTVVDAMGGKTEFRGFNFSVSYRKKYDYNERIQDMESELKKAKKDFEKNSEPSGITPVFTAKAKQEEVPI